MIPTLGEVKRAREVGRKDSWGQRKFIWVACEGCSKERWVKMVGGKPVFTLCRSCSMAGSRNHNWKGGMKHSHGYVFVHCPKHPRADRRGYIKRAILVLEAKLGRLLLPDMDSHHRNEIKDDDRPGNLEEKARVEHSRLHRELQLQRQ